MKNLKFIINYFENWVEFLNLPISEIFDNVINIKINTFL